MSEHTNTLEPIEMAHGHEAVHHHGPKNPPRVYLLTLTALLILTIITVAVAHFDLGEFNVFAAIGIATIKATLVALFFMHLLHDKPMNGIILCTAFTMLGLLLTFCFLDSGTRYNIVPANSAAPAGIDFNRPKNLGVPYAGEKSHGKPTGTAGATETGTAGATEKR
jgi:cytochrome c oxidase subunit IV